MDKPKFVYVMYINTKPEELFNALIDGEMTRQYWWRHRNASDWKPGSKWRHEDYDDPKTVDIVGKVVESKPPKRLVLTWAFPADEQNDAKHSRVTFEIEPYMEAVRLIVTHEDMEPDSPMLNGITEGWPKVLSSLKTMLETGKPLAMSTGRKSRPD